MSTDAITDIENDIKDPNKNYNTKTCAEFRSISDVDTFFSRFNHANNYTDGLNPNALGGLINIFDGTYNTTWQIAGFDVEHNRTAADGTVYDNGYGIALIPATIVTNSCWNQTDTTSGGYKSSYIRLTPLSNIILSLMNVLGSHLVNRNVLLSSSIGSNGSSNAYTWTTDFGTLLSVGQMNGNFASYNNKYDDGEANYKLPLFEFQNYYTNYTIWTRNIYNSLCTWACSYVGTIYYNGAHDSSNFYIRPMIYLR